MKYGGKAMKGVGTATATTGKSMGKAVLHPSQTLRGAGQAVKTATIGGAVGYVGWEKLTTDKSVVRIVSDAVIGEPATNTLAETADGVRELTGKAGEAVTEMEGFLPRVPAAVKPLALTQLGAAAEQAGDKARAVSAYEEFIKALPPADSAQAGYYKARIAALK